jgi:hypothetical protein
VAERFCFQGAINYWIFLGGSDDLKKLVEKYTSGDGGVL